MKVARSEFGDWSSTAFAPAAVSTPESPPVIPPLADEFPGVSPADEALRAGIRILIVDDDRTLREGCATVLRSEGYSVTVSGRGDEALELVKRSPFDILMVDLYMTPVPGMEILKAVLAIRPEAIVIMVTGNPSVNSSVEALRIGAWDYLPKPFSGSHLQVLLGRAALAVANKRDRDESRSQLLESTGNSDKITLLGASPTFRRIVALAHKVAQTDASVLLSGESGTGKELIAQFIHRHSRRASSALVPLNCAAIPEHLLESEMFGHKKGSFTGADREKVGLLEVAHKGTFFLDELTEMPMPLQAKLLRVVQDGVLRRVGSEQQDAQIDVRFISATNRDPREAIRNKQLREDLFYRLNVFPIVLPPLRERVEDIPILAKHFLEQAWKRHHNPREEVPYFGVTTLDLLQSSPWRGNVRELQNVVEHAAVLATPGAEIGPDEIVLHEEETVGTPVALLNSAYHVAKEEVLTNFEREYLKRLVARASGNMSRAARLASIDRTTLYRLLERHGFRREPVESTN